MDSKSGSSDLVKIHKRERSSPTAQETSSQVTKKRYKLVENIKVEPSSSQVKVAPESRADFLREVGYILEIFHLLLII